jgi:hypothetical protein
MFFEQSVQLRMDLFEWRIESAGHNRHVPQELRFINRMLKHTADNGNQ